LAVKVDINKCRELGKAGPRALVPNEYTIYGTECAQAYNAGFQEAHQPAAGTPAIPPDVMADLNVNLANLDLQSVLGNQEEAQARIKLDQYDLPQIAHNALVGTQQVQDNSIGRGVFDSSITRNGIVDVERTRVLNETMARNAYQAVHDKNVAVQNFVAYTKGELKTGAASKAIQAPTQPLQLPVYTPPKSLSTATPTSALDTPIPKLGKSPAQYAGQPYGPSGKPFIPGVSLGMYPGAPKNKGAITPYKGYSRPK
jgi:hypothetical protein